MSSKVEINAYAAYAAKEKVKEFKYEREIKDDDVRIKIDCCGICYSDLHKIDSDWAGVEYPFVGGHEIVGTVAEVGSGVQTVKVGQRVGVGPFQDSCGKCEHCEANNDNLCYKSVFNYDAKDKFGRHTYGGFADGCVVSDRFAVPIPEALSDAEAAPLLCAGVTVYAPLARHVTQPKRKIAIVAIGGLGHLAVQFAAKMHDGSHHVVAVSRGTSKKELCLNELGASEYVDSTDAAAMKALADSCDYVLHTAAFSGNLDAQLALVKPRGMLCVVGVPDCNLEMHPFSLVFKEKQLAGSLVGSPKDTADMLAFAAKHGVRAMVSTEAPMADINEHLDAVREGKPRFRIVLKN